MDAFGRCLLTYLLHSTLLLGGAALACRALRERRLAFQEALVRAALVGAFLTSGLQLGLGFEPLGGVLRVRARGAEALVGADATPSGHRSSPLPGPAARPEAPGWHARVVLGPAASGWLLSSGPAALTAVWGLLAAAALVRLGVAARRLRRLLRDRRSLRAREVGPETEAIGRALGLRRPVRLSSAPRLSAPLATGVLRPEVCLPPRAVTELDEDARLALYAHEVAHVVRRDPAWILLARLVECAAPLQPLNAWARGRMQELAECLSDDLSVSASGRPLGLARSLVDVASWSVGDPALVPAAVAGALSTRGRLGHRVERLMDSRRPLERSRRALLPLAVLAVLATALVTPVVSGSAPPDEPSPAPAPQPAPEAQPAPHPGSPARAEGDLDHAAARRRLQELTARIEARARANEGEMRTLEKEIEAIASRIRPNEETVRRASREIEAAAEELAAAIAADLEGKDAAPRSDRAAAARRMAQLQDELRAATKDVRVPEEDVRALAERARALAERARPTPDEMREIRSLADVISRQAAEQSREAMRRFAEEMRRAAEELRARP
jgi:beta-lactamase regulating signal transducer with metallopeptidase domain